MFSFERKNKFLAPPGFDPGWMVRGSNPMGGEIFHTRPDRDSSLLYNGYRVFPGGKEAGT